MQIALHSTGPLGALHAAAFEALGHRVERLDGMSLGSTRRGPMLHRSELVVVVLEGDSTGEALPLWPLASLAHEFAQRFEHSCSLLLCGKVPVGAGECVQHILDLQSEWDVDVVSHPVDQVGLDSVETLLERLDPRFGCRGAKAKRVIEELYGAHFKGSSGLSFSDWLSVELAPVVSAADPRLTRENAA